MNGSAILVVGTTSDYIALIDKGHPGRCLFVTTAVERHRYPQLAPQNSPEILTDINDFNKVLQSVNQYLKEHKIRLSGVVCYDCESMNLAAFLSQTLNLIYPDTQTITNCRDKYLSKQIWRKNGLNCARSEIVRNESDTLRFFDEIAGPIVVKPQNGSGSELTFKCTNQSECRDAMKIISSRLDSIRSQDGADNADSRHSLLSSDFIVEEFISGQEYSGDFIIDGENVNLVRLARKIPAADQTFGTTLAYQVPAPLSEEVDPNDLAAIFKKAAQTLGIKRAICMVDFMIDRDKLHLLEMSPRPGGDCLPFLIRHSLGLDIFDLTLGFAEQKPVRLPDLKKARSLVGARIFAEHAGILADIKYPALEGDDRVVDVYLKYAPGHKVIMPPDDYDSRILGHIIFEPTAGRDITEECRQLLSHVKIRMEKPEWTKISA